MKECMVPFHGKIFLVKRLGDKREYRWAHRLLMPKSFPIFKCGRIDSIALYSIIYFLRQRDIYDYQVLKDNTGFKHRTNLISKLNKLVKLGWITKESDGIYKTNLLAVLAKQTNEPTNEPTNTPTNNSTNKNVDEPTNTSEQGFGRPTNNSTNTPTNNSTNNTKPKKYIMRKQLTTKTANKKWPEQKEEREILYIAGGSKLTINNKRGKKDGPDSGQPPTPIFKKSIQRKTGLTERPKQPPTPFIKKSIQRKTGLTTQPPTPIFKKSIQKVKPTSDIKSCLSPKGEIIASVDNLPQHNTVISKSLMIWTEVFEATNKIRYIPTPSEKGVFDDFDKTILDWDVFKSAVDEFHKNEYFRKIDHGNKYNPVEFSKNYLEFVITPKNPTNKYFSYEDDSIRIRNMKNWELPWDGVTPPKGGWPRF